MPRRPASQSLNATRTLSPSKSIEVKQVEMRGLIPLRNYAELPPALPKLAVESSRHR